MVSGVGIHIHTYDFIDLGKEGGRVAEEINTFKRAFIAKAILIQKIHWYYDDFCRLNSKQQYTSNNKQTLTKRALVLSNDVISKQKQNCESM